MRIPIAVASLLLALPAQAQQSAPAMGNLFDEGRSGGNPGNLFEEQELLFPTQNNSPSNAAIAARFTAHHSLRVTRASIGMASRTNHGLPGSVFEVSIVPDNGSGPSMSGAIFRGTFAGGSVPSSGPALITVTMAPTGTVMTLTEGTTYDLIVYQSSYGDSFTPLSGPQQSPVEPVQGAIENPLRTVFSGSTIYQGANPPVTTFTDQGREPIFAIEYQDLCSPVPNCYPVDGNTYLLADSVSLAQFENAAEAFRPAAVLPAPRERIFAVQVPASTPASATLTVTNSRGTELATGTATDTNRNYRNSSYDWFVATLTDADAGAITLATDGGTYAVSIKNSSPVAALRVPFYDSLTADGSTVGNRGQYLGGAGSAYMQASGGGSDGGPQASRAMPFQLCGSEILGNGVDEDCSGADETDAGQVYVACHDHDRDGFGDPADAITLSFAGWGLPDGGATPPPGYVADCSDCNDNDSSVHVCDGGSSGSISSSSSSSGSSASSATSGSGSSASSTSGSASGSSGSSGTLGSSSGSSSASSGSTGTGSTGTSASTGSSGASSSSATAGSSGTSGSTGSTGRQAAASSSTGGAGSSGRPGPSTPATFKLGGGCGCQTLADPGLAFLALALLWRRRARILRA